LSDLIGHDVEALLKRYPFNLNLAMKLKAATIWLSAIALVAVVVVVLETQRSPQMTEQAQGVEPIFEFEDDQIQAMTLTTPEYDLSFVRADAGWQQASDDTKANDASVAYLLNLLVSGESDRILEIPADDWGDFGFDEPLAVIEVTVENNGVNETRSLTLGAYDFNGSSIYALRDLPETAPDGLETLDVLLVTPDFENAVSRPLAEWTQPDESPGETENTSPDDAIAPEVAPETETSETETSETETVE
jgi:hypothetical protein